MQQTWSDVTRSRSHIMCTEEHRMCNCLETSGASFCFRSSLLLTSTPEDEDKCPKNTYVNVLRILVRSLKF
ncbi:hypothetical protein MPTK1_6g15720 [Marchantia polymorpha subsp. ruderalis]|uniref:Uncharacterized protein n=2 Tax=Marchantia polymorpha TaxID=3197 RepID=A0AAF6BSG5_MARPO|nr:hypothetical protein MARPO_0056s0084 [Marchantia polymorpha]BBN14949.1 hypothetical protein Mp_6g15720 [Marchantia polymorpha subsp. ruderalis]|eukprot:PTQ37632.1 hypothetical protein MARPO_0056s0084 [Marchantia polymorpha]